MMMKQRLINNLEKYQLNLDLIRDFKMVEKFYVMSYKGATRYIILVPKNISPNSQEKFLKLLKKGKIIFTEGQGKSHGDLLGGSWVTKFFSTNFIDMLKKNNVKSFNCYLVKFESKYENNDKYYYVEPSSFVDSLVDGTFLEKRDREKPQKILETWFEKRKQLYYDGDESMKTFYNFSEWDGSDLFGGKNNKVILVTEKLKKTIEKAKLKNIKFEELKKFKYTNLSEKNK